MHQTVASSSNDLGPWLAFIGALIVVCITAATTQLRQRQQLKAERDRLILQLAHDRELHDLRELRSVLDEVVGHATSLIHAFSELALMVRVMVPAPNENQQQSGMDIVGRAFERYGPLAVDWDRLTLRLGTDHPVTSALALLRTQALEMLRIPGHGTGPFNDEQRSAMASVFDAVRASSDDLLQQAHRAAASRVQSVAI